MEVYCMIIEITLYCYGVNRVTYMDFFLLDDGETKYRLSAFGTLDGWIGVGLVDMNKSGSFSLKSPFELVHPSLSRQNLSALN